MAMIFLTLLVLTASGQHIPKEVRNRLNSITRSVEVSEHEKSKLIIAIQKLINGAREIRKARREHMELELRENSLRYLTEVLIILDDERYEKWRADVQRKNRKQRK